MKRFFKYVAVGASGIVVNEFFLFFFTEIVNLFFVVSSIIAIELSIISNFLLNDYWTFRDRVTAHSRKLHRGLKFNLVSLAGMGINVSVLYVLTAVAGFYYLFSNLVGIGIAFFWNYTVNFYWTWRKHGQAGSSGDTREVEGQA